MKTAFKTTFSIAFLLLLSLVGRAQDSYTWKGTVSKAWEDSLNWQPKGVPGLADTAVLAFTAQDPELAEDRTLKMLKMTGDSLNLGGKKLIISDAGNISYGCIYNGTLSINKQAFLGQSGKSLVLDVALTIDASMLSIRGTRFTKAVQISKTGVNNQLCFGGNTYEGKTSISNRGSGSLTIANSQADTFQKEVYLGSYGTGFLNISPTAVNTQFYDDMILNCTGAGIRFCQSGGSIQLNPGTNIRIGEDGFSSGTLNIKNTEQLGKDTTQIILTDTAQCYLQSSNHWRGYFFAEASSLRTEGNTFEDTTILYKFGKGSAYSAGGNRFQSTCIITAIDTGNFVLGTTLPDTFEASLYLRSLNSSSISIAQGGANTRLLGDVYLSSLSGKLIRFAQGSAASCTLAAGKKIYCSNYRSGDLYFNHFTQLGATAQDLLLEDSASVYFQNGSTWGGSLNVQAPNIYIEKSSFASTVSFSKTGKKSNSANGGNEFKGKALFATLDSGTFNLAAKYPDTCRADLELNVKAGLLQPAYTAAGSLVEGDIIISSTGKGIKMGQNKGTLTLKGRIIISGAGYSSGTLQIGYLQQQGTNDQHLLLTGTALLDLKKGNTWSAKLKAESPTIRLDSNIFLKPVQFTKTGVSADYSQGGNIFSDSCVLINTGTGSFTIGSNFPDSFAELAVYCEANAGLISLAHASANNLFQKSVYLHSSGQGIRFCQSKGTAVLGAEAEFYASNFNSGSLCFRNIDQQGTKPLAIFLSDSATLYMQSGNTWKSDITISAPSIKLDSSTYKGKVSFTKTGRFNDNSNGGNTFEQEFSMVNQSGNDFIMGIKWPDYFKGEVKIRSEGKGYVRLAHSSAGNRFDKNISLYSSGSGISFGQNKGTSVLDSTATIYFSDKGVSSGKLQIKYFQQLGHTEQSLTLSDSAVLELDSFKTAGILKVTSPSMKVKNSIFGDSSVFVKTVGPEADNWDGGNVFNGPCTIRNQSNKNIALGVFNGDRFYKDLILLKKAEGMIGIANRDSTYLYEDLKIYADTTLYAGVSGGYLFFCGAKEQYCHNDLGVRMQVKNLSINKAGGSVHLSDTLFVEERLDLQKGKIHSSELGMLVLGSKSTFSGYSNKSFVEGPVLKVGVEPFIFPIGKGDRIHPIGVTEGKYSDDKVWASYSDKNPLDSLSLLYKDEELEEVYDCQYWKIKHLKGSTNLGLKMYWYDADSCQMVDYKDLVAVGIVDNNWQNLEGRNYTGSLKSGSLESVERREDWGIIALGARFANNPFSYDLVDFKVQAIDSLHALINWVVASEPGNDHYVLERSIDGYRFDPIKILTGTADTIDTSYYEVKDTDPIRLTRYYRLRQYFPSGYYTVSRIIELEGIPLEPTVVRAFPNPYKEGTISVLIGGKTEGDCIIRLIDQYGKEVFYDKQTLSPDTEKVDINPKKNLPKGLYIIYLNIAHYTITQKLVVGD